jgi:hypothetical protein
LKFPDGLRALNLLVEVQHDHFPEDTDDDVILSECGLQNWVYVSQDRNVRRNPAELQALIDAGIHSIFLHGTNRTAEWTIGIFRKSLSKILKALGEATDPIQIIVMSDGITILNAKTNNGVDNAGS